MACISCGRGFHDECTVRLMHDECCCTPLLNTVVPESVPFSETIEESVKKVGRPQKPDSEITTSAGRKRAAVLYLLDPEADCEWQGLANCGGGKFPIVGCLRGKQQH